MTEVEFKKLADRHNMAQENLSEARGALKSLRDRLQEEFGLKSPEEARDRLKELERQKKVLEVELNKALVAYQKEFPE
jgi:hypothetical protein